MMKGWSSFQIGHVIWSFSFKSGTVQTGATITFTKYAKLTDI